MGKKFYSAEDHNARKPPGPGWWHHEEFGRDMFQLKDGDAASALNRMSNRGRGCYLSADNIIGIHVRLGGVWHFFAADYLLGPR